MIVGSTHDFDKKFKKRISFNSKLVGQLKERINLFIEQPNHELLRVHSLAGSRKGYCAFSITGDIRIVFKKISDDEIILVDIGSHNQVY